MAEVIDLTLEAHAARVASWRRGEPGSWGYLAGKAVLTAKNRAGRPLTEQERRAVWQQLWERLERTRALENDLEHHQDGVDDHQHPNQR